MNLFMRTMLIALLALTVLGPAAHSHGADLETAVFYVA